jgi:hypothetical protein
MHGRSRQALLGTCRLLVCATLVPVLGPSSVAAEEQSGQVRPREIPCVSLDFTTCPESGRSNSAEAQEQSADARSDTIRAARAPQRETSPRTLFRKWVHLDVMWIPPSNNLDAFGLIGTHLAIANIGRLYIYGPPGVMLLRQRHGAEWMLRPAFTWGFSFYLTEFSIPGWEGQSAQLFANVTKVWTEGDQRNGIDMVGLSLTFRK